MIRSVLTVCGLLAVSTVSFAQALTPSELEVDAAFKALRPETNALLRLVGNEYFGSTTTPIQTDLFWNRPGFAGAQDMRIEMLEARNALWNRRVVADGRHVWGVDLIKNTYSTARYGSYNSTKPNDYESNGMLSVGILANGESTWPARLVREVWGGNDALYRPWIPLSSNRSEFTVQGVSSTADPVVTSRVYTSSLIKKFHIYWLVKAGTPVRSVTFELDQNQVTAAWNLTAIYFSDRVNKGTVQKLTDWKLSVYTGTLPSTGNFTYTPAAGARAIAGPRPNGSG
jgi:hypothetical protein